MNILGELRKSESFYRFFIAAPFLCLLAVLSGTHCSWAEGAKKESGRNLDELYRDYRLKNYFLKAQLSRVAASQEGLKEAKARYYPSLALNASTEGRRNEGYDGGHRHSEQNSLGFRSSLELQQPLFNRGLLLDIWLSKIDARKSSLQYTYLQTQQALNFVQSYLQLLSARIDFIFAKRRSDTVARMLKTATELELDQEIIDSLAARNTSFEIRFLQLHGSFKGSVRAFFSRIWNNHEGPFTFDDVPDLYYPKVGQDGQDDHDDGESYDYLQNMREDVDEHLADILSPRNLYSQRLELARSDVRSARELERFAKLPPISLNVFLGVGAGSSSVFDDYTNSSSQPQQTEVYGGLRATLRGGFDRKHEKRRAELNHQAAWDDYRQARVDLEAEISEKLQRLYSVGYGIFIVRNESELSTRKNPLEKLETSPPPMGTTAWSRKSLGDIEKCDEYIDKDSTLAQINSYLQRLNDTTLQLAADMRNRVEILSMEMEIKALSTNLRGRDLIRQMNETLSRPFPTFEYLEGDFK